MRVELDRTRCTGHAQCYAVNPDLFPIDDDGYSIVEARVISPEDEGSARDGAAACPEQAIRLDD